jgi:AbrB family looped-hinge helix DNA binding protein
MGILKSMEFFGDQRRTAYLCTVTAKGQLTLPKEVRTSLGFTPGTVVVITVHDKEETLLVTLAKKDLKTSPLFRAVFHA